MQLLKEKHDNSVLIAETMRQRTLLQKYNRGERVCVCVCVFVYLYCCCKLTLSRYTYCRINYTYNDNLFLSIQCVLCLSIKIAAFIGMTKKTFFIAKAFNNVI